MGATGESVRRLTDFGFAPDWSLDSKSIVVSTEHIFDPYYRTGGAELWIVDVATGSRRLLAKGDAVQPRWSPDGRWIAFGGCSSPAERELDYPDLWLATPEGKLIRITNDAAMDWSPVWAADSRTIYFCSDRGGSMNIWRLTIDPAKDRPGEGPIPIIAPARFVNGIDIARNGSLVILAALEERWSVMRADFDPEKGSTTSAPFPILRSAPPLGASVHVSPDGEWVAFTTHGQQEDLFLMGTRGGGHRRVTENVAPVMRGPAWSPDGQRIAFYCNREPRDRLELWSIRPDGSGLQQLSKTGSPGLWFPTWSPDGRALVAPQGRDYDACTGREDQMNGMAHDLIAGQLYSYLSGHQWHLDSTALQVRIPTKIPGPILTFILTLAVEIEISGEKLRFC